MDSATSSQQNTQLPNESAAEAATKAAAAALILPPFPKNQIGIFADNLGKFTELRIGDTQIVSPFVGNKLNDDAKPQINEAMNKIKTVDKNTISTQGGSSYHRSSQKLFMNQFRSKSSRRPKSSKKRKQTYKRRRVRIVR